MPNENDFEAMCKADGVRDDEAATLKRSGVTESMLGTLKDYSIGPKKVRDLYHQFGPSVVPVLIEVSMSLKPPKPKESTRRPTARASHPPAPAESGNEPRPGQGDGDMR